MLQLLWLDDLSATDPLLVGGKAAMLARLLPQYRVPAGFCLRLSAGAPMPEAGQQAIADAYNRLMAVSLPGLGVAVRSSAIDEDGRTASFAGQHETVLNVATLPALLAAIERCWASAWSPQALAYRRAHGLATDEIPFAVLVQQMIAAESSAVAFSVDPVSGDRTRLVIDGCWGVGDWLVGGQMTPDHFVVNRNDLTIGARQIVPKPHKRQLSRDGVATVPAAKDQQTVAALRDEQVIELARLALALEAEFGWPVDVECAYQGNHLYLLQCRPITTLTSTAQALLSITSHREPVVSDAWSVEWDQPADGDLTWHGRGEFVLPLQQSLSLYYYQGWAKAFRAIDVEGGLRARFVNGYEYRLWQWTPRHSFQQTQVAQRQREQAIPHLWATEWLPQIVADLQAWNDVVLADLSNDELGRHLQTMLTRQLDHWAIHAVMGDVPLTAVGRLVDWYLQRFPAAPESEPYQLVQGQFNTSTEANHELWRLGALANRLRVFNALPGNAARDGRDSYRPPEMAVLSDEDPEFRNAFYDYCRHFGQFTREQQQHTLSLIRTYAGLGLPDPKDKLHQLLEERTAFTVAVRAQLTEAERQEFDELLACALANNPLTESHNLYLDQMSDASTKRVIAEFAQRLHAGGVLAAPDDIAYLSVYELLQWGYGLGNPLQPLITARKAEYVQYRQLTPPSFIGKAPPPPGESGVDRFSGPTGPLPSAAGIIRGIGASPGVARGRALVAYSLADALALQQGDILVCRSTDPTWTPFFVIAGGLVTDFGGSLSHAAVVAREYQLPAVVGTHLATQQIATGQWVAVDGLAGVVCLL